MNRLRPQVTSILSYILQFCQKVAIRSQFKKIGQLDRLIHYFYMHNISVAKSGFKVTSGRKL
jgi:hypothetical protein